MAQNKASYLKKWVFNLRNSWTDFYEADRLPIDVKSILGNLKNNNFSGNS